MVRVKVCGITNLEDASRVLSARCDALGFVFYKKSPRYIRPPAARKIIKALPRRVLKIGVFVNAKEKEIRRIAKLCCLDMLQFHGNESVGFCFRFTGYKIIKAFRIKEKIDLPKIFKYNTYAYLFDTFTNDKFGGTGKKFNWGLLKDIKDIKKPVFLSGGLTAVNVRDALKLAHPAWVDVSSSVEISPGKKDHKKVKEFIQAVKNSAL